MERQEFETRLRKVCEQYDLSVATYFSLASGYLTGKYRKQQDFEGKARQGLTEKYFNDRGKKVLDTLDNLSKKHRVSNAGVAIAWILQRPNITTAIASATKENHLASFEEALKLQLPREDMERLNEASQF